MRAGVSTSSLLGLIAPARPCLRAAKSVLKAKAGWEDVIVAYRCAEGCPSRGAASQSQIKVRGPSSSRARVAWRMALLLTVSGAFPTGSGSLSMMSVASCPGSGMILLVWPCGSGDSPAEYQAVMKRGVRKSEAIRRMTSSKADAMRAAGVVVGECEVGAVANFELVARLVLAHGAPRNKPLLAPIERASVHDSG